TALPGTTHAGTAALPGTALPGTTHAGTAALPGTARPGAAVPRAALPGAVGATPWGLRRGPGRTLPQQCGATLASLDRARREREESQAAIGHQKSVFP
ncbi:hypothetical protein AB0B40_28715, partial [Streptomyces sp. NPDC042638]